MNSKQLKRYLLGSLLLAGSIASFGQKASLEFSSPLMPGRQTMVNSFYNDKYFIHDTQKRFIDEIERPKIAGLDIHYVSPPESEISLASAVDRLENPGNTIVFDATVPPEKAFLTIESPEQLHSSGGTVLVSYGDKVKFLTEVDIVGTIATPDDELAAQVKDFRNDCVLLGYTPSLIKVMPQGKGYVMAAYKSTSTGQVFLYQRANSVTRIKIKFIIWDVCRI